MKQSLAPEKENKAKRKESQLHSYIIIKGGSRARRFEITQAIDHWISSRYVKYTLYSSSYSVQSLP